MKNAPKKKLAVILLDAAGKPETFARDVLHEGPAGFGVAGLARTLWWGDEGKTWKRAEK